MATETAALKPWDEEPNKDPPWFRLLLFLALMSLPIMMFGFSCHVHFHYDSTTLDAGVAEEPAPEPAMPPLGD